MGIVAIGAVFVDIKGYPNGVYIPAGRNVGRIEQVHGGVSRNVVENIANVDLKPTFLSLVDYTGISVDVLNRLKQSGVNTEYIRKTQDGLGTWLAIFDSDGDVVASISKRPDLLPILAVLDEYGDEIFSNADSILVEFDIDVEILDKIFELSEKYHKQVYAVISNMSIAVERRKMLKKVGCMVCNLQEAEILFQENYSHIKPEDMAEVIFDRIQKARIPALVVTMGENGAAFASLKGEKGYMPARKVDVIDTTGAGDAFFSGVSIGLTYGKNLKESCEIGTRMSASVIGILESVCPHFRPEEFGL